MFDGTQANCIKNVIEGELALEFKARSMLEGSEYDWDTYGAYLSDPDRRVLSDLIHERRATYYRAEEVRLQAVEHCRTL